MEELVETEKPQETSKKGDATKKQIRGSSLLLFGRLLSVGLNFASQVLIVRYLSKADFGAWAYALSVVAFFQGLSTLGLDRGITRFIPIYHERDEQHKLLGTIIFVLIVTAISSVLIIASFHAWPEFIAKLVKEKDQPVDLILIMIFLVPVDAIDGLLIALFASFASPRAIFFRKHVLAPGLKLTAVLLLVFLQAEVDFLAWGYLTAGALGVAIYGVMLLRLLYRQGTFDNMTLSKIKIPAKEILAFTIPLLSSDLVTIVMHSLDSLLLGYYHSPEAVGAYRAILPAAHFNKVVATSFALLYTPLAARLFANGDNAGINELYWKTAIWMAVLSFPVFALTFSLAQPLTVALYGARYESSWVYLALMSFGYYFNTALGFNGLTLKVLGKIRYVVIINTAAGLFNLLLAWLLIPPYGALGAALATAIAMVVYNILKQAGLRLAAGLHIFEWQYLSFYLILIAGAALLFVIQWLSSASIYVDVALAALVSFAVLAICKKRLKVEETFPELMKLPLLKKILK